MWAGATYSMFVVAGLACTASHEPREADTADVEAEHRLPTIDHVVPARDSVGEMPTRFEWTPGDGADHYAIGMWDDVDRLMWRADRVQGTSVLPKDIQLEFGTYFWSVAALRADRPVADSCRSAFVVKQQ